MDDPFEAGIRIHDFKIIKVLGTGGMGIVYLANQTSLNRLVALKVLGPTIDDPKARARFRRESRAVALLKHPGIAEVYYVGQNDTLCYMATEYIEGATLRQLLDRVAAAQDASTTIDSLLQEGGNEVGRLETRFDVGSVGAVDSLMLNKNESEPMVIITPVAKTIIGSNEYIRRCCLIVRDAALALEHAHSKGVVHRDVKPQNLMLDRQGAVHVIDFGVARFRDDVSLSQTGALVGTPMYMSPEHISGRVNIDHRSDIFSLGITLYEALTLRPPYSAQTREGIFRQIVSRAMPPVSTWNGAIARPLEAVVHKAIARDPEERYQTAEALAHDLQHALDNKPVTAQPYRYKFDKREIVAERPASVLISSSFVFLWGSLLTGFGLFAAMIALFDVVQPDASGSTLNAFSVILIEGGWAIITFIYGIWMLWTARGLLIGKRMSPPAAIASHLIVTLIIASAFIFGYQEPQFDKRDRYISYVVAFIFILMFFINLILLCLARTRRWFRLARTLRSEYAQRARAR